MTVSTLGFEGCTGVAAGAAGVAAGAAGVAAGAAGAAVGAAGCACALSDTGVDAFAVIFTGCPHTGQNLASSAILFPQYLQNILLVPPFYISLNLLSTELTEHRAYGNRFPAVLAY